MLSSFLSFYTLCHFRWFKNGKPVDDSGGAAWGVGGLLVLPSARLSDSAAYSCSVNNSVGTVKAETQLTIEEPVTVRVSCYSSLWQWHAQTNASFNRCHSLINDDIVDIVTHLSMLNTKYYYIYH